MSLESIDLQVIIQPREHPIDTSINCDSTIQNSKETTCWWTAARNWGKFIKSKISRHPRRMLVATITIILVLDIVQYVTGGSPTAWGLAFLICKGCLPYATV